MLPARRDFLEVAEAHLDTRTKPNDIKVLTLGGVTRVFGIKSSIVPVHAEQTAAAISCNGLCPLHASIWSYLQVPNRDAKPSGSLSLKKSRVYKCSGLCHAREKGNGPQRGPSKQPIPDCVSVYHALPDIGVYSPLLEVTRLSRLRHGEC